MKIELKTRKRLRLEGFDYSQPGKYFLTIVTRERKNLFGYIKDGNIILTAVGKIVDDELKNINNVFSETMPYSYVIMPNHVHILIIITGCTPLTEVVRWFKAVTTFKYHKCDSDVCAPLSLWQKSFYDIILTNERMFAHVEDYIKMNPLRWENDKLNPFCKDNPDEIMKSLNDLT